MPSTDQIKGAVLEAGFDLTGVAPVHDFSELSYFPQWIAEGRAGEMRYLESRDDTGELKRTSLARVAPWARSVVVCAVNYNTVPPPDGNQSGNGKRETGNGVSGWISRYAWSQRDYHDVIMEALRRAEARLREFAGSDIETRSYVDTGPLVERVFAHYAGIGWVGKNTCIINQKLGSWLFLGVILTSLELTPDLPAQDRCGSCTRCLDACPTNAFLGPHKLDASRCISYLTIEKRGAIPEDLRAGIGLNVFGCDICQDVCPWNRKAPLTTAPDFQPRPGLGSPDLTWLATMSEEEFRSTFRGSPIKRTKRTGLRRNAVVAMGNSRDPRYLSLLQELSNDPDEVVAQHARWALQMLQRC